MSKPYTDKISLNYQSGKVVGTKIQSIDFCRGCDNDCESCFALSNSRKTKKDFSIVVLANDIIGKTNPNFVYRLGNRGDPAHNWKHNETKAKELGITNNFCVTKLQSIKGFSGYFTRLQVSVDPFNPKHFAITLKNITHILNKYPKVQIVLRVRSSNSKNESLNTLQEEAVAFANTHNLPILETRVRFRRQKDSVEKYQLNTENYHNYKGYLRPKNFNRFLQGVKKHSICDESGKYCKGCKNCLNLWKETT